MATRVFKYGLLLPRKEDNAAIWGQMRAAHHYYNKLIEIERRRRKAYRELRSELNREVATLEGQIAELSARIDVCLTGLQSERKAKRSARTKGPEKEEAKRLKAERRVLVEAIKKARATAKEDPVLKAAVEKLDERSHQEMLEARANCGVYSGTYLLVEAAFHQARKARVDPEFKRWDGTGRLGVQIQRGIEVPALFARDTRIQITPVDPGAWALKKQPPDAPQPVPRAFEQPRRERRKRSRTVLRFRVNSNKKGGPVWAEWPMVMHRPLPEGALIMGATISARKHANWTRYSVDIICRVPDVVPNPGPKMIGIDLGWRKIGEEIRVASWVDSDGKQGELRLPPIIQARNKTPRNLRGVRDEHRDKMLPVLVAAIKPLTLPDETKERTEALSMWRSFVRLHKLFWFWKTNRFEGDEVAFHILETWHHRDLHLYQYECGARSGALGHRQEIYRIFAAQLAKTYGRVVLERWNISEVAERKPPEEDTADSRDPNRQRFDAGVSELRLAIINAVERDGGLVWRTPAEYTTLKCHACGHVHEEHITKIEHTCDNCGLVWDQDENAARNLLASGVAMQNDPELLLAANPPPKPRKPRFANKRKPKPPSESKIDDRSQLDL